MKMRKGLVPLAGALVIQLMACSSAKPVLYPNSHLQSVGQEVAQQDIDACKQLAESAGAEEGSGQGGRVAASTAVGAGVGAASGAVGGAISGAAGSGSMIGGRQRSGMGSADGAVQRRIRPFPSS